MANGIPFQHSWTKLTTQVFDACASGVALFLGISLAIGRGSLVWPSNGRIMLYYALAFAAVAGVTTYSQRLYRGIWRFTSFNDCVDIFRATVLSLMIFVPAVFVMTRASELPRSATIIAGLLMIAFLCGPRVLVRALCDRRFPAPLLVWGVQRNSNAVPILLIGNTSRAEHFIHSLQMQRGAPYAVVGILTNDANWHGRTMHGIGVLGGLGDLEPALAFLRQREISPQRLVIANDQINEDGVAELLKLATQNGLTLGRLPRLMDLDAGASSSQSIQPILIGDLLGRPQVVFDCDGLRGLVRGKRVLVTGAGGSIGSELVRQLSDLEPSEITLLENTEFNLYSIDHELEQLHPGLKRASVLCDIRDIASVNRCFSSRLPEIVFHAAALKHVPMVEINPIEGIRTNALGTQNIADACVEHGVAAMVLISTDKAVNPHNVMGATKRCAEAYCQALDAQGGPTRFVAVRFGNVLGSTGSVVPLFQRQLAAGGPITITHPDITRYFMTIPEAVRLVLQASVLGASGAMPRGHVYVLDMGKPIKILELAQRMIRLAGKEPDRDVKIVYTGLRPGEKLYEELAHAQEELTNTPVTGLMMVSPRTSELPIIQRQFSAMSDATGALDQCRALSLLSTIVPEFHMADSPTSLTPQVRVKKVTRHGALLATVAKGPNGDVMRPTQPRPRAGNGGEVLHGSSWNAGSAV